MSKRKKKRYKPYMIVGSLQAHASRQLIESGVCPTIGCTDLSLPKLIEVKDEQEDLRTIPQP